MMILKVANRLHPPPSLNALFPGFLDDIGQDERSFFSRIKKDAAVAEMQGLARGLRGGPLQGNVNHLSQTPLR